MPLNPADVTGMATRYAAAWSSHNPDAVVAFYEDDGVITINNGDPCKGTAALLEIEASTQVFVSRLVKDSVDCAVHARRVTLTMNDVKLAKRIGRSYQLDSENE